nr:hypothetical protein [Mycobacterium shinjukuense]
MATGTAADPADARAPGAALTAGPTHAALGTRSGRGRVVETSSASAALATFTAGAADPPVPLAPAAPPSVPEPPTPALPPVPP